MAAYAYTAVLDGLHSERIETTGRIGILTGTVDVTNYNSTNAAISEITGNFRTVFDVQLSISDGGYGGSWTGTSIKVWTFPTSAGPATEVADDTDAGVFQFTAIGIRG